MKVETKELETDLAKPGVLVIGPNVWGKGQTMKAALEAAHKPKRFIVYAVPSALSHVYIDDVWGTITWKAGVQAPYKIWSKGMKEKD